METAGGGGAPTSHPRDVSLQQLAAFKGVEGKRSYVSLNGLVFDVSDDLDSNKYPVGENTEDVSEEELEAYRTNQKYSFIGRLLSKQDMMELTEEALKEFIGEKTETNPAAKIYLSAKGMIFDVTAGKGFYGPEGGYHKFAGKNCQRALALTSLKDEDVTNSKIEDLSETDLKTLDDWIKKYMEKYSHVGFLKA